MTAYDKMKWHSDAEDFPQQLPTNQGAVHIAFLPLDVGASISKYDYH